MPFQITPKTQTHYKLIAFSKDGTERGGDPDAGADLLSKRVIDNLKASPTTDVFLFSHGWRGDVDSAIDQYNRWIDAMAGLPQDAERMGKDFQPLWIGVHWPSEPWGNEDLNGSRAFAATAGLTAAASPAEVQNSYLQRLDLEESEEAKAIVQYIFAEQRQNAAAKQLPKEVADAYQRLAVLMQFQPKGAGAEPGNDTAPFDPESAFEAMNGPSVAFGGSFSDGLLAPLRTLSFWNMKRRARTIGSTGVYQLLEQIQTAAPNCGVHLMGHSFGTIVVSSACGQKEEWLPRPIDSLALVQGAVSLWSFADQIQGNGGAGYYNPMCRQPAVRGPIVTTQSRFDLAVSRWYKAAVGLVNAAPDFGDNINLIKWGAIGQYGIQGLTDACSLDMAEITESYPFKDAKTFNLESSKYICKGGGFSGAHSDIDGPQVAHLLWQTAINSRAPKENAAFAATAFVVSAQQPRTEGRSATMSPAERNQTMASPVMPVAFGVQAETGAYLPSIQPSDLNHIGKDSNAPVKREEAGVPVYGVIESVKADDLALAGWGIIFAAGMKQDRQQVRDALQPLLDLRKQQAENLYQEFQDDTGYVAQLSADEWLNERGSALAVVDPKQGVPYYLLLVGSPDDIPFDFQYDLDTFFAVGRLYFADISEYRRYAENVVAYETAASIPHENSVAIFAARNPGDAATQLLHDLVCAPMALGNQSLGLQPMAESHGYTTRSLLNQNAKKQDLLDLVCGEAACRPALLFTGSHGVAFAPQDPEQNQKQGAILTQEWNGPGSPVTPETYLTAAEVTKPQSTLGMIHYFFACYSAACPVYDTYSYGATEQPVQIAGESIISRLAQQILLNGAQAVIGHVDRAWAYSFQNGKGTTVGQNVRDPIDRILAGRRVGDAMDSANQRWSVLSVLLTKYLDRRQAAAAAVSDGKLANAWVERDDARNYIVLGDPACRLRKQS